MTELEINMIQFWPVYRSVEILSNLRITTECTDLKSLNILATVFLLSNGRGTALNVYTKPKFTYLGTFFHFESPNNHPSPFCFISKRGSRHFSIMNAMCNSLSNFTMWNKVKWFFFTYRVLNFYRVPLPLVSH